MTKATVGMADAHEQEAAQDGALWAERSAELLASQESEAALANQVSIPEQSEAHRSIDLANLNPDDIVVRCAYFAALARRNPELARASAEEAIQHVQHGESLRRSGMSEADIRRQQVAAMRANHQAWMRANSAKEPAHEAPSPPAAKPAHRQVQEATAAEVAAASPPQPARLDTEKIQAILAAAAETAPAAPPLSKQEKPAPVSEKPARHAETPPAPKSQPLIDKAPAPPPATKRPTPPASPAPKVVAAKPAKRIVATPAPAIPKAAEASFYEPGPVVFGHEAVRPAKRFDGFVGALKTFITRQELQSAEEPEAAMYAEIPQDYGWEPAIIESRPEPAPTAAVAVVERLAGLTEGEQEVVIPTLEKIVVVLEKIEDLQADGRNPEAMGITLFELKTEVAVLLEQLGLERQDDSIEQLVGILLQPEFLQRQPKTPAAGPDLRRHGTREAKWQLVQQLTGGLTELEHRLRLLLGRFALA